MRNYLVIVVLLFCGINNLWAMDGAGTQAEPYLIQSMADFNEFSGNSDYWAEGVYTRLETDVNLAGAGDNPDGSFSTAVIAPDTNNASYSFDGNSFDRP